MRKLKIATVATAAVLGLTGLANAQTVTSNSTPGALPRSTTTEITLKGDIQSAVRLDITTRNSTAFNSSTNAAAGTTSVATIDFGTFSTVSPTLTNGRIVRTATGTPGAFAVADLTATIQFNGASVGTIFAERKVAAGSAGDVVAGNLRLAAPGAAWTDSGDGSVVDDPGVGALALCPPVVAGVGGCASGDAVDHELAVFVPDTQNAGTFTTVVTYVATAQ